MRKFTIGQGEDYTTRCLLDYEYIKNHYYKLIAVVKKNYMQIQRESSE